MKFVIHNYFTYTESFVPSEHRLIYDSLKYFNENFKHINKQTGGTWDGWSSLYVVRLSKGQFLTGFLDLIFDVLCKNGVEVEVIDERIVPEKTIHVDNVNYELRDYQDKMIYEIMGYSHSSIDASMGSGKTVSSLDIFLQLGVKTMILVHRKNLMYQNYKEYKKFAPSASVGLIGDGKFEVGHDLTVAIINTVSGRLKRKPETIKPFLESLGCIISDESHVAVNKQFQSVLQASGAYYRIGQSGTLEMRNDEANMNSQGMYGPIRTVVTTEELVEKGHLSQVYYKQLDVMFPENLRKVRSLREAYERGITFSQYRNGLIVDTAVKFLSKDYSPVILFKFRDHGESILETMKEKYPHVKFGFMHGETPIKERMEIQDQYNNDEIDIIVSSLIFSTGVNVPKIDCIIYGGGGQAQHELLQIGGRGSRKKESMKAFFIDFNDMFHSGLQEYSAKRKQFVNDYPGYIVVN